MKQRRNFIDPTSLITSFALAMFVLLSACEDVIQLELEEAPAQLVVDAWINDLPRPQIIELTASQAYFDQTDPPQIADASVYVRRDDATLFQFDHTSGGSYVWEPSPGSSIGQSGDQFELFIEWQGTSYMAVTTMNRVPRIDSIGLEFRQNEIFLDDGLYAQFYARDFPGAGDTYWIKTFKNGEYLDKSQELNLAYDAGFDAGTGIDGLIFIPPIREAINQLDEDLIPKPYVQGDEIRVEVHSISTRAFNFMEIARDQINNGDNGIFALPLANTRSNVMAVDSDIEVLGFFNVAAVSAQTRIVE